MLTWECQLWLFPKNDNSSAALLLWGWKKIHTKNAAQKRFRCQTVDQNLTKSWQVVSSGHKLESSISNPGRIKIECRCHQLSSLMSSSCHNCFWDSARYGNKNDKMTGCRNIGWNLQKKILQKGYYLKRCIWLKTHLCEDQTVPLSATFHGENRVISMCRKTKHFLNMVQRLRFWACDIFGFELSPALITPPSLNEMVYF